MKFRNVSAGLVTGICLMLGILAGCRKPVYFPAGSDRPSAEALGAFAAYDADLDGKLDYFAYVNEAGRIDRIAYDVAGRQRPGEMIRLDAIPFDHCRHLVLILDGFGYDVVREYYDAGGLRMFHKPSRVIAPYPTMTDLCLQDTFGGMPCRAYEAKYFDRSENRFIGGSDDYLAGKNEPYNRLLQYRATTLWDAIGYISPWAVFGKEINDAKRQWDRAETQEMLAYFVSSAGMSTQGAADGQRRCLERVEQFINQVIWETRGMTKVTLLSDHGHSYTQSKRIDFERFLRERGWRPVGSLKKPKDVAVVLFGLVGYATFATQSPAALAADLTGHEGVEVASYADSDTVVVLASEGQRAIVRAIFRGSNGRFAYETTKGDPLKLAAILAKLQADAEGYYDADALLAATVDHEYPAPLQRIWRAHFALAQNAPDVIASLKDGYFTGLKSFAGSVNIRSTHGGLNRRNTTTFIMSTAGPLPGFLRSRDIPSAMNALTGADWPMRK